MLAVILVGVPEGDVEIEGEHTFFLPNRRIPRYGSEPHVKPASWE